MHLSSFDSRSARLIATLLSGMLVAPLVGCDRAAPPAAKTPPPRTSPVADGALLFRGIFFGDGPAVDYLPAELHFDRAALGDQMRQRIVDDPQAMADQIDAQIAFLKKSGASDDVLQRVTAFAADLRAGKVDDAKQAPVVRPVFYDAMIDRIGKIDPTFFARFDQEMTSGDVVQVDRAVDEAVKQLGAAAESYSSLTAKQSGQALPQGLPLDNTINITEQVNLLVDVAINVFQIAIDVEAVAVIAAVVVAVAVFPDQGPETALQRELLLGKLTTALAVPST